MYTMNDLQRADLAGPCYVHLQSIRRVRSRGDSRRRGPPPPSQHSCHDERVVIT